MIVHSRHHIRIGKYLKTVLFPSPLPQQIDNLETGKLLSSYWYWYISLIKPKFINIDFEILQYKNKQIIIG
jgi:hypothetical protein